MKNNKIFISGTNTEVGKTFITVNIIKLLQSKGYLVNPYKPVETGCRKRLSKLVPNDSSLFHKTIKKRMSLDKINPYRFLEPISPATAIKLSKKRITINNYLAKYKSLPDCDFSVIEGAGGLLSPLASDGFNIDLIKKIKAPTILVAKDEIGVINNVMLSLNILKQYKIKVLAVILNRIDKVQPTGMNNYEEIEALVKTPLVQILNKSRNNQKEFTKLIRLIIS
jgi:dethiobiotin synthetase|tara:strand:- start:6399 stop:7070 length:672 start_codon:yes stop_codon:yes gene_type:complete